MSILKRIKSPRCALGRVPIYEPGLSELVLANQSAGRLALSTSLREAAQGAKAIFIAVGTPSLAEVGSADLRYVYAAAREIAEVIEDFTVVVVKSTVPVGTCDEIERIIAERLPREKFSVVSNPEFLREGAAIEDFKQPDRIVVGVEDERAASVMREMYQPMEGLAGPLVLYGATQLGNDQIRRQRVSCHEGDVHQ